jgi:hypothetical protein
MRLTELSPQWLDEAQTLFVFLCPHCRVEYLSCKNVVMLAKEQRLLFEKAFGPDENLMVVGSEPDCAWQMSSKDFENMSITPLLDASKSGHWHGHITNGEIVGGLSS